MIRAKDFRELCAEFGLLLKALTHEEFFTELTFQCQPPEAPCQYWEYELSFLADDLSGIQRPCGYFVGKSHFNNTSLGISEFFRNNDLLMDELDMLGEAKTFDPLIPLLTRAETLVGADYGVSVGLNSKITGGSDWLRGICDEQVCILHLDDESKQNILVGCQQLQRYKIKVVDGQEVKFLYVPFDKV